MHYTHLCVGQDGIGLLVVGLQVGAATRVPLLVGLDPHNVLHTPAAAPAGFSTDHVPDRHKANSTRVLIHIKNVLGTPVAAPETSN